MSDGGSRRRVRGALARLLFALLLFFAGAGAPAHAADPSAPDGTSSPADAVADEGRRADAKRRFLLGLELAKAGQWDAALAEFTASRELHRTRVASRNMAIALHQLGRNAEALDAYTALLEEFSSSMPPDELERVKDELAAVRPLVAELEITSSEPGSIVVVDGRQRGTTPLSGSLRVDAGTRTVRVSREGFETFEERVTIAGGQKKAVRAALRRSSATGTLVVQEASGAALDVLVDGAVVGKTPWRGALAAGSHNVVLRGDGDLGTPPSSAVVKVGETDTLTLRAVKLDAAIRVEPTPSNATVFVDGVSVGNGVWEGRLSAGPHLIELTADGHRPFRREVTLAVGRSELLRVALERDLSNPLWSSGFVPHLYVEAFGGVALAGSLGGSAAEACDSQVTDPSGDEGPGCAERSRPFGFLVGARGGYAIVEGLGLEVELGYLTISESMTRRIHALGEPQVTELYSDEYHDETRLAGPLAALAASYRVFERTPLTVRVAVGVARLRSATENRGTFRGAVQADPMDPVSTFDLLVAIPEKDESLWAPFVRPEIRFGYRFSRAFSIDAGLGALILVPAEKLRTARNGYGGELRGAAFAEPVPTHEGGTVVPGTVRLPRETIASTFVAAVPTLGLRVDF